MSHREYDCDCYLFGAKLTVDGGLLNQSYILRSSKKNGTKESVVLPYQEFIALREWIEDMENLLELREAKRAEGGVPGRPLEEVAKDLGL